MPGIGFQRPAKWLKGRKIFQVVEAIRKKVGDEELAFTYVGDNLKKDFISPNALGWMTVCLRNDGRNIHPQDFSSVAADALPKRVIDSLFELLL